LTRRSFIESFCRDLGKRCLERLFGNAQRPSIEILYKDLAKRPLVGTLYTDLAERFLTEILPRELL
jgi:hypothetical protein